MKVNFYFCNSLKKHNPTRTVSANGNLLQSVIFCVQYCSDPLNCDSSSPQINSCLLTVNVAHVLSDYFPISCFVFLQNIDAMLVLEACGSLVLYTGVTRVPLPV